MIRYLVLLAFAGTAMAGERAGVAAQVITPNRPIWLAGYASRNKPSEGKAHELYAKAVALEDAAGTKLVFVSTDLIGLPKSLADDVAKKVQAKTGLPRANLMLTSSHTHSGPVLRENLADMYEIPPEQLKYLHEYTARLGEQLVDVVVRALADLRPATLEHGHGRATFAINRRQVTDKGVVIGRNPAGPVDHSVPVLVVRGEDRAVRALVFGYACHNTTLAYYKLCGDYAGFAQAELEAAHNGAVALFWAGCAADANPDPRGKEDDARAHGKALARAVEDALAKPLAPVAGSFRAAWEHVELDFAAPPTREQLKADTLSKSYPLRTRAARLLALPGIPTAYPEYPVQAWKLGDAVLWFALGGEVVVDYALRIRKDTPTKKALWVTGYANDVMAYIPSRRILGEGGYEADSSMVYYGHPTRWADSVEDRIHAAAQRLVAKLEAK